MGVESAISPGIQREPGKKETGHESITSAVFIGGATSKMKGLGGVDSVLKSRFGADNVSTYNSILSPEWSKPDRFVEMAKDLKEKMSKGPLKVIAHSFGAAELYAAMATDLEFFQDPENIKNLELTLISPTLPKNFIEGLGIAARYVRIGIQEGTKGVPFGKTKHLRGISSSAMLPVEGMPFSKVQEESRAATPKISHINLGTSSNIVDFTDQRDYRSILTTEENVSLNETDSNYREAMNGSLRKKKSKAIYRRGVRLHDTLNKINANDWTEEPFNDTAMQGTDNKLTWKTAKMTGKLMKDNLGQGKVYDMVEALGLAGVKTKVVIPEFDTMITRKKAQKLNKLKNVDVVIAPHTTHSFPWADQPELLLKILDHES